MKPALFIAAAALVAIQAIAQTPSSPPPNPGVECIAAIAASNEFDAIKGKMALGSVDDQTLEILANVKKPTKTEKAQIARWVARRQSCMDASLDWYRSYFGLEIAELVSSTFKANLSIIADLYAGKLTYGDCAKQRARVDAEARERLVAIIQRLTEKRAAAIQQQQQQEAAIKQQEASAEAQRQQQEAAFREQRRQQEAAINEQRRQQAIQILLPLAIQEQQQQEAARQRNLQNMFPKPRPIYNTNCYTDRFGNTSCTTQ